MPAEIEADVECFTEQPGERYFVAKTGRAVCVVNYQPSLDNYVGGPFLTWAGAFTYIDVRKKNRRMLQMLAALPGAALLTLLTTLW